jgi:hypothetical protein
MPQYDGLTQVRTMLFPAIYEKSVQNLLPEKVYGPADFKADPPACFPAAF